MVVLALVTVVVVVVVVVVAIHYTTTTTAAIITVTIRPQLPSHHRLSSKRLMILSRFAMTYQSLKALQHPNRP